jgi:dihydrofolate reductase
MNIFLIAALSADGFLAENNSQLSTTWTSKEDYQFFIARCRQAGVTVWGKRTFETVGRPMKGVCNIILTRDPEAAVAQHANHNALVLAADTQFDPTVPLYFSSLSPQELVAKLKPATAEIAVLGGSHIYHWFMAENLVDQLYITVEPVVFGQGVSLFAQAFDQPKKLSLIEIHHLSEQTKVLQYSVSR